MDDEIKFKCELCGEVFDAHADAMVECIVDAKQVDIDTGEVIETTEEEEKKLLERVGEADPTVKPFLKGAVCICQECLAKFEEYESDLSLDEDEDE